MALPLARPPKRPKALTASGAKVEPRDNETNRLVRSSDEEKKAFSYVRIIPELNYASRFYSKMLKKVRIFPALRDASGTQTPITSGPPLDLLDRIQDPGGGRSAIQGSYGRLMFIAGQGHLFGRNLDTPQERWAFVSASELERSEGKWIWKPTMGGQPQELPDSSAVAYRFWTPDPEHSGEAESPMRAVLEIAEELRILTKAVRSTAVTRMLNGILKVPSELSFGSDTPGLDDDPEENPLLQDLIDHITGAIENAGTAEAAAPFIAEGMGEFLTFFEWIRTHDPATDYMEQGLRAEAVTRLSVGLDMPPEILKGLADTNHWGARQIMLDTWRSHGAPVAQSFCDDIAEAYLRPALQDANFANWDKVVVAYDDAEVVISPDRTEDADRAYDRGQIDDEGYLELKGINKSFAAKEEHKRIYLAVKLREPAFLKGTAYELEEPKPAPFPPGPAPSADGRRPAEEGPPLPGPAGVSRQESRSLALKGAAELALLRCRELAGSRIRQAHKRDAAVKAVLDGRPNTFVAAIIGRERLNELGGCEPLALVRGGAETFVTLCLEWGIDETQARALSQVIEVYAARTLFERRLPQFPSGFAAQLERANELSAALEEEIVRQNNDSLARLSGMAGGDSGAL